MRTHPHALFARVTRRLHLRRRGDEAGAVLILTAAGLMLVMGGAAMTVDIGHQVAEKRKMQTYADQAAGDALGALGTATAVNDATTMASSSLHRNNFDAVSPNVVNIAVGNWDSSAKTFTAVTSAAAGATQMLANAVQVCISTAFHYNFIPGDTTLSSCATALKSAGAGVQVGSFLSRVTIGATETALSNAILGSEFGSAVNVTTAGYQGLSDSSVTLGDLVDAAGNVGTVDNLLNQSMTVGQVFTVMTNALNAKGDATSLQAAAALNLLKGSLQTGVGGAMTNSTTMKLRDIISMSSGDGSVASATAARNFKLRSLDLAQMAVQAAVANGTNLVHVTLPLTLAGVDSITMDFSFIEKPQAAWGPVGTVAKTAQARLYFLETLSQTVPGLGGTHVQLPVYIEGAGADGTISSIACAATADTTPVGILAGTRAAQASIGNVDPTLMADASKTVTIRRLGDLVNVGGAVTVTSDADATVLAGSTPLTFNGTFDRPMQTVGSTSPTVSRQLAPRINIQTVAVGIGLNANLIGTTVSTAVSTQLNTDFDTGVLDRIGAVMGLRIAGADVWNNQQLLCDLPQLVK